MEYELEGEEKGRVWNRDRNGQKGRWRGIVAGKVGERGKEAEKSRQERDGEGKKRKMTYGKITWKEAWGLYNKKEIGKSGSDDK